MSTAALTYEIPDPAATSVEALLAEINRLTRERQELRSGNGCADELERNRREIVRLQWQLSHALLDRHGAPPPSAA